MNGKTSQAVSRLVIQETLIDLVSRDEQATLDNFEESLNDAVTHDGCVQFAWATNGRGKGTWSYTAHPGYCGSENDRYDSVTSFA